MWSRDTDKCLHSNGLAQLTMCPSLADGGWYGLNLMTITTYATGQQSKALPLLTKLCKWWASSDTSTRIIMSSLRLYVRVVSPLSIYDHIPVRVWPSSRSGAPAKGTWNTQRWTVLKISDSQSHSLESLLPTRLVLYVNYHSPNHKQSVVMM
jgi:hypothetical protein